MEGPPVVEHGGEGASSDSAVWRPNAWFNLALPHTSYVTVGKLSNLFAPQFHHL